LRKALALAGFREIKQYAVGSKTDPVFAEAMYRTRDLQKDVWMTNEWGAMAVEAVR
jgi:hypothetical protein